MNCQDEVKRQVPRDRIQAIYQESLPIFVHPKGLMMSGLSSTWRVIASQGVLVCVVALICYNVQGFGALGAALFGGALAGIHTWMLGHRVKLAHKVARRRPGSETTVFYVGAIQRFAMTLMGFAVGMGVLGLSPVPLLIAFALAQMAFFMSKNIGSSSVNSVQGEPKGG